jgi:hypothetical protein
MKGLITGSRYALALVFLGSCSHVSHVAGFLPVCALHSRLLSLCRSKSSEFKHLDRRYGPTAGLQDPRHVLSRPRFHLQMSSAGSPEEGSAGNATNIFSSVGAAGNLRFRGEGFKSPPLKADEPNFSVKPAQENPALRRAMQSDAKAVSFSEAAKDASFANLVDFPCTFQIKVVGARQVRRGGGGGTCGALSGKLHGLWQRSLEVTSYSRLLTPVY